MSNRNEGNYIISKPEQDSSLFSPRIHYLRHIMIYCARVHIRQFLSLPGTMEGCISLNSSSSAALEPPPFSIPLSPITESDSSVFTHARESWLFCAGSALATPTSAPMDGAFSTATPSSLLGGGLDEPACESLALIVDCDSENEGCLDLVTSELVCEFCTNEGDSVDGKSGALDTDVSLGGAEVTDCEIELLLLAVEV